MATVGDDAMEFEERRKWQLQKEELEKELYDCTKAHKMSIHQSAYAMAKLQVSFILVKNQASLAREQLEDSLGVVKMLQAKVERLNGQVRSTETENRRLNAAMSSLTSELANRSSENETLQRALETAERTKCTKVTAPMIAQQELLEGRDPMSEATAQLQELREKLVISAELESELVAIKLSFEKVTQEKEEVVMRLEAATKELKECKTKIAETELHDAELGRYAQVLNVEKITLMGQLELLRAELDKQVESVRVAQIGANKAMEAERECAKALKLVEEKEEEMEYYIKQLESLREKNCMLRTQLDMEQQCKEVEIAAVPKLHDQCANLLSRNLNTSMELVASNSIQDPQKTPPDRVTLDVPEAIPEEVERKKSSNDAVRHETSSKGKGRTAAEGPEKVPNPEPVLSRPPSNLPLKRSTRLRNRVNTQHSTDSASATTGVRKQVVDLVEEENDENDGVIVDVTQTNRKSVSRLKRPPVLVPSETETSKKKGRKKYLSARSTDVELGVAHLLVGRSDRDGMSELRPTPLRPSRTPRSGSRLPR